MEVFYVIAPSYYLKNPLTPAPTPQPPLCAANACASKHVVRSLHNIYQPSLASATTKIKFLDKFKKRSLNKTTMTNVSLLWVQPIWIPLSAEKSKKVLTLVSVFKLNQDSRQIWRMLIFISDFFLVNNYPIMFLYIHTVGQNLSNIAFVFYKIRRKKI